MNYYYYYTLEYLGNKGPPVFDNQKLYDTPSYTNNATPPLSIALIICMGVVIEHKFQ